jgi:preprotein translocase subunit YajC
MAGSLLFAISFALVAENGADGGAISWLVGPWFPFIAIGILFYFMLIRPERRKRAEMTETLNNLKKNDHVVTIGGIYGVVVNASKGSEDVTIRVDDSNNTKLRILRSAVSRVISVDGGDEKKDGT